MHITVSQIIVLNISLTYLQIFNLKFLTAGNFMQNSYFRGYGFYYSRPMGRYKIVIIKGKEFASSVKVMFTP